MSLKNKICLVTGATHGIGKEISNQLLDSGAIVYGCSRGNYPSSFSSTRYKNIICDISKPEEFRLLFDIVPTVDILINNAGGGGSWGTDNWLTTDMNVWHEVYSKNVTYIIHMMKQYIPAMILNKWGRVVTISSIYGKENGGKPWYQVAKSAQISLMKSFASNSEYASNNITFNTICPGRIDIQGTSLSNMKITALDTFTDIEKSLPRKTLGTPAEVANAVSFICSEKSSLINGACIVVDGCETKSF